MSSLLLLAAVAAAAGDLHDLLRGAKSVHELCEIGVLGHDQRAGSSRRVEDLEVGSALQRQVADADAVDTQGGPQSPTERGRQVVVEPDRHVTSRRDDRMGQATARESKAGGDVLELQIRKLLDHLRWRQA